MNMFVFCHQVFGSKVFDSENMFVYISVCLVIYKFIYMDLLKSVYIYMSQHMTKGTYGCVIRLPLQSTISKDHFLKI